MRDASGGGIVTESGPSCALAAERWGEGTVQRHDADQVAVLFDEHGYREVSVLVVAGRGLLLQSAKA